MGEVVEQDEREHERSALDRLAAGLGSGGRAAGGPEATLEALNERRVEVLLLQQGLTLAGGRCPRDGLLTLARSGPCPADGVIGLGALTQVASTRVSLLVFSGLLALGIFAATPALLGSRGHGATTQPQPLPH